eukprot:5843220-Heterocapsa_arctica.AAC.1
MREWCQGTPEADRGDIVDAHGILTKKGEDQFTKETNVSMVALQESVVASDLEGMYSRSDLENRASDFAA